MALLQPTKAVGCYPGAEFPKTIGYGILDTEIRAIAKHPTNDVLALVVYTLEPNFVGNAPANPMTLMYYNVGTDSYLWVKVVSDVDETTGRGPYVHFSGDGNRLLFSYYSKPVGFWSFIFFDPTNGAIIGANGMRKNLAAGDITSKDCITLNSQGTRVYYILKRNTEITATIAGLSFDGTNWSNFGFFSWNLDNTAASGPAL